MAEIQVRYGDTMNVKMDRVVGCRVTTTVRLANTLGSVPARTVARVDGWHQGNIHLKTEPCDGCGMVLYLRGVPRSCVEFFSEDIKRSENDA